MTDVNQLTGPMAARIDALKKDKDALVEQRGELALLIKQAGAEVDHLSQRSREVASKVRQVEANLDSFSKAEIKSLFATSQESQMRLFMMQSQLEQLRSRQSSVEKMEQQLAGFLSLAVALANAAGDDAAAAMGAGDDGGSSGQGTPSADSASAVALRSIELSLHRVSSQLQEGTAQLLSDLILRAEVCERMVDVDPDRARQEMAELRHAASGALRKVRHLVQELQPPSLEELGLPTALRRYLQLLRTGQKLAVDLQVNGTERRLPGNLELALFRVIQEALSNSAHHSESGRATLKLDFGADNITAVVSDEGIGFDLEAALASASAKDRSGLSDMYGRARLVGGTLEIATQPGSGCTVTFSVACP